MIRTRLTFLILLFAFIPIRTRATGISAADFDPKAFAALPPENSYSFVKALAAGLDPELGRRAPTAKATATEMTISTTGWTLLIRSDATMPLEQAEDQLRSYLKRAMLVQVSLKRVSSLRDWSRLSQVIVAGTRDQMPGCGAALTGRKDYEILVSPERIAVCGFDEAGAMYGLYNLEEQFSLREGPFLPRDLDTVRHSLYRARLTLSGIGWMEWPDKYLAMLARYGFDSIYASGYANPTGVVTRLQYRLQHPAAVHDLIRRAARYGIRVYCPIIYTYMGTPKSKAGLQKLVRVTIREFPEIRGYVLLTEGFDYGKPHAPGWGDPHIREWVKHWAEAVRIVTEECHKLNPAIEVLPWDYSIDRRPFQIDLKKYVIDQLPQDSIPLVTFENGKSFMLDGEQGSVNDYSISQAGPSEVAAAQIAEAKKRGMRGVYAKADTWLSWQFGTSPYLPFPYQWYARYEALRKYGIDGTMESWSYGFKPNFVAEMRAWYSWSDAPPLDKLLRAIARRDFGSGSEDLVLNAWKCFSAAIRLYPDTGFTPGNENAVANPLFFEQPKEHIVTFEHSWIDERVWRKDSHINPYWPYVRDWALFYPDFTNRVNVAEKYVKSYGYVKSFTLPVFTKYLQKAADEMETGLRSYRQAAMEAPASKREHAFREVLLAEQIERMMRSNDAILEFENLRFHLVKTDSPSEQRQILDRMTAILRQEMPRTQAALETARRDSRLGYSWEEDYLYWPQTIERKLRLLRATLDEQIPAYWRKHGLE